jgi:hypothetical protein
MVSRRTGKICKNGERRESIRFMQPKSSPRFPLAIKRASDNAFTRQTRFGVEARSL